MNITDLPVVFIPANTVDQSIDMRSRQKEIECFAQHLIFKPKQCGIHFKKHKVDHLISSVGINTSEKYLAAAQTNIVNAIFENGFVLRTNMTDRVAFFTSNENKFPIYLTSIGTFSGEGKLMTFFVAHGATPSATAKNFKGDYTYIAHFEKGVSVKGWQELSYSAVGGIKLSPNKPPQRDLDAPINFLKC